uniref:Uncharacterized protein n=1 Tax=Calcidiscus leptoporus TaxID=127549 RepID=A0A7S0JFU6_9EUKA
MHTCTHDHAHAHACKTTHTQPRTRGAHTLLIFPDNRAIAQQNTAIRQNLHDILAVQSEPISFLLGLPLRRSIWHINRIQDEQARARQRPSHHRELVDLDYFTQLHTPGWLVGRHAPSTIACKAPRKAWERTVEFTEGLLH